MSSSNVQRTQTPAEVAAAAAAAAGQVEEFTRESLLQTIADERQVWHALVAEVGPSRWETPGAMGAWTFRDLAAHLTFWSDVVIANVEAGPGGKTTPFWPSDLDMNDDDSVNAWVQEQQRQRSQADVFADADALYDRLTTTFQRVPDAALLQPNQYAWVPNDMSLAEFAQRDLFVHLHEDHEPDVRTMLAANPIAT